jgi:hypothetical protein
LGNRLAKLVSRRGAAGEPSDGDRGIGVHLVGLRQRQANCLIARNVKHARVHVEVCLA